MTETDTEETSWSLEIDRDGIAWLHADKAGTSTNVLSAAMLSELENRLDDIESADVRGLIILSDKKNGFFAGADVQEFTTLSDQDEALALIRHGQSIFDRVENLSMPTVAMIHGFCVGGGLELALACRYRVAVEEPTTRLGLPEILLGIHPGFGGSMRLVRLIGAPMAMDMMLSGRTVDGRRARRMGIVDVAVPLRHLRHAAIALIEQQPPPHRPGRLARLTSNGLVRPVLASVMRKKVAKRARYDHYPAPYALIDVWSRYGGSPRAFLAEEAASVARLITGSTAQNLIRVFFLQEQLKNAGKDSRFEAGHVHVVGAGVMGGDIAAWCALKGCRVTLQDRGAEFIAPALVRAHKLFQRRLKKPRLVQAAMDRLIPDIDGAGVAHADLVIEAIVENLDIKQSLFESIEPRLKPGALLATNTSSIPLEDLGTCLQQPGRLVGIHFFNPVAKMQLVEIVRGNDTDAEVAAQAAAFVRSLGKLPLPVSSSPGFLVNRILMPYLLEAVALHAEGVPAAVIDRAAVDFGMPMGPVTLADTVGLDICLSVADILAQSIDVDVPDVLRQMVEQGHLGIKSGEGFYHYRNGKQIKPSGGSGKKAPADLADRMVLRMLNEAVACLREGVVSDADMLDAGMIFGTGFAPFRGGPMHYLSHRGEQAVRQRLENLQQVHGKRFSADAGWNDLLAE